MDLPHYSSYLELRDSFTCCPRLASTGHASCWVFIAMRLALTSSSRIESVSLDKSEKIWSTFFLRKGRQSLVGSQFEGRPGRPQMVKFLAFYPIRGVSKFYRPMSQSWPSKNFQSDSNWSNQPFFWWLMFYTYIYIYMYTYDTNTIPFPENKNI